MAMPQHWQTEPSQIWDPLDHQWQLMDLKPAVRFVHRQTTSMHRPGVGCTCSPCHESHERAALAPLDQWSGCQRNFGRLAQQRFYAHHVHKGVLPPSNHDPLRGSSKSKACSYHVQVWLLGPWLHPAFLEELMTSVTGTSPGRGMKV